MSDECEVWSIEQAIALLCTHDENFAESVKGTSPTGLTLRIAIRATEGIAGRAPKPKVRGCGEAIEILQAAAGNGQIRVTGRLNMGRREDVSRAAFVEHKLGGGKAFELTNPRQPEVWSSLQTMRSEVVRLSEAHSPGANASHALGHWRTARGSEWLSLHAVLCLDVEADPEGGEAMAARYWVGAGAGSEPPVVIAARHRLLSLLAQGVIEAVGRHPMRPGELLPVHKAEWSANIPEWRESALGQFREVMLPRSAAAASNGATPYATSDDEQRGANRSAPERRGPKEVYQWAEFRAEVERFVEESGGIAPSVDPGLNGFRQKAINSHMRGWCIKTWTLAPGATQIAKNVREVLKMMNNRQCR